MKLRCYLVWAGSCLAAWAAGLPAFPGAEGFGANAVGGRGGDVYHVTNLNDSGPGSLRYGIQTAAGPRTIVFDVSGTIFLQSALAINKPYLTIAGQTAPGTGITIAGWGVTISRTHDVILRYLRFRPGDLSCTRMQGDSLSVDRSTDVIIDHISASWSIDETLSVTNSDRVTVQWSFITESLDRSCHAEGAHGYGSLLRYGDGRLTFHHNLYAHHRSRNPRLGDDLSLDFVNNVIYNYGVDAGYSGADSEGVPRMNFVANYVIAGPSTSAAGRWRAFRGGGVNTQIYQRDNLIDGNLNGIRDGVDIGWTMFLGSYSRASDRFEFPQVETDDAGTAYRRVLGEAGCSLVRDPVDARIISEVMCEGGRIIDSQEQVGGWPELVGRPAALDTDQDGMPDAWEREHGLDPQDPTDGRLARSDGYTNLERYLNELATLRGPPGRRAVVQEALPNFGSFLDDRRRVKHSAAFLFCPGRRLPAALSSAPRPAAGYPRLNPFPELPPTALAGRL